MTHPIAQARLDGEAAALRLAAELGRKFEPADIARHTWLRRVATSYAIDANEDFGFMGDMLVAAQSRRGLTDGQAKGVLNVLLARSRPRPAAPVEDQALPNLAQVPSARYRVVQPDGTSVAIRLDSAAWAQDKPEGTRTIAIRAAEGWNNLGFVEADGSVRLWQRGRPFQARIAPAMTTVANGVADGSWLVYALSYAQEGGECAFCGKELDTQESLTVGYGPTCAKKHGLPWGAKAEPMTVVLARQAAAVAAPAPTPALPTPDSHGDGWGEAREFVLNTTEDAPAPKPAGGLLSQMARQIEGRA